MICQEIRIKTNFRLGIYVSQNDPLRDYIFIPLTTNLSLCIKEGAKTLEITAFFIGYGSFFYRALKAGVILVTPQ